METFSLITDAEQLATFSASETITLISSDELASHAPDAHWLLSDDGTSVAARCSLWWRKVPEFPGQRLGFIGHYAARDKDAAGKLLHHACAELAGHGCTLAVGPMDGTTWRRYRLITQRGGEPPFFLEPDNPDTYPEHFEASGFRPLARYYSSLDDVLNRSNLPEGLIYRLQSYGISLRQLDPGRFTDELSRIHEISVAAFRNNFLYSDISRDEFIGTYTKVQPYANPELVLFAEQEGRPVGFIFALPDMLRIQKGNPEDTVIIKSMAVMPEMNGKGVGVWLLAQVSNNASALGYKRAIHALMHENNRSRTMSSHYGHEIRQYTLYSRDLS